MNRISYQIADTQRYRVQSDSASDYGGYKRKKKSNGAGGKPTANNNFGHRLPSRPQSSCAITEIGVPERRWYLLYWTMMQILHHF